jgi:hypothetical protein
MAKRDPRLRAFAKVDKNGDVVAGVLLIRKSKPQGHWEEIIPNVCCTTTTTTSTTTSTSTTSTTTA